MFPALLVTRWTTFELHCCIICCGWCVRWCFMWMFCVWMFCVWLPCLLLHCLLPPCLTTLHDCGDLAFWTSVSAWSFSNELHVFAWKILLWHMCQYVVWVMILFTQMLISVGTIFKNFNVGGKGVGGVFNLTPATGQHNIIIGIGKNVNYLSYKNHMWRCKMFYKTNKAVKIMLLQVYTYSPIHFKNTQSI